MHSLNKKVNELVFCPENYDDNIEEMWFAIMDAIITLTKNQYQVAVREEDFHIVAVEFEHSNPDYGCPRLYWIDPEDFYDCECLINSEEGDDSDFGLERLG